MSQYQIRRNHYDKISKEDLMELPLKSYQGETILIRSEEDLMCSIKELEGEEIIGFDTESRPAFRAGVQYPISLIQLATSKKVYLFQLNKLGNVGELSVIWENKGILKVGIAIRDDIKKLKAIKEFEANGFLDISDITKRCGIHNTGLRPLVGIFLGVRISKTAQTSNWSQETLTEAQIQYAATDAWMSRLLFMELKKNPGFNIF